MTRQYVLDRGSIEALGIGNVVLARMLFGIAHDVDNVVRILDRQPRFLVPALSLLRAGRQRYGLADHIADLQVLSIVPLAADAVRAACGRLSDLADDAAHAVYIASTRNASIITPEPKIYPESSPTILLPT
ncbi:hypothetical protein BS329_15795 [Amycolatopsis coloradensis]|uniref:Uncharacterized protein n=1 Tax=Amycolatopsis coloradensis TaxID=76021 RepID=A0A1R0KUG0_9PSEU|nr:hypothetical protein [Amycolatopsis coloradensis]OLZ51725.1 hypothetical protein BS329_15795 [Amycolatopsis coloradensis]